MGTYGVKTGGRDFVKGHPGGPGRPKTPEEIKELRRMTHSAVAEVGSAIIAGDIPTLKAIVQSAKTESKEHTVLKVWFASCALKAISKGDSFALNELLKRIVGNVKTEIEVTGANGGPVLLAHMTLDQVREEYDRLIQEEIDARNEP